MAGHATVAALDVDGMFGPRSTPRFALVVGLILAGIFAYQFARQHTLRDISNPNAPEYSLESACTGHAATPFRYRVLVPWAITGVLALWPSNAGEPTPLQVMFPIDAAATFFLIIALWLWLREWSVGVYGRALGILLAANALIMTYLLPIKLSYFYWYDILSVLFFTLGLLAIKQQRTLVFYCLFLLGTLNRETTYFLSVAFLVLRRRDGRAYAAVHGSLQALLWLGVKLSLAHAAAYPPLSMFWWELPRNMHILGSHTRYDVRLLMSMLGFIPLATIAVWPWVRNRDAKLVALIAIPFLAGMALVGFIEEIRIYGELLPVLLPACVLGITGVVEQARTGLVTLAGGVRSERRFWGTRQDR